MPPGLLGIKSFFFLGVVVALGQLGPECGDCSSVAEVVELRWPVHIAPSVVEGLVGKLCALAFAVLERIENNVNPPTFVRLELDREAVVSAPILRPVIHDGHDDALLLCLRHGNAQPPWRSYPAREAYLSALECLAGGWCVSGT